jgi:hypothetical protein
MKATSRDRRSSLATHDRAFALAGVLERRGQLGPEIERVCALAGLCFDALVNDGEALGFGEAANRFALGLEAEAGFGLLAGGDAQVGDDRTHVSGNPQVAGGLNASYTLI